MDEVGWDIGGGWRLTPSADTMTPMEFYILTNPSGIDFKIAIDRALPDALKPGFIIEAIKLEQERYEIIMMAGGGDVRPEPDGT